MTAKRYEVIDKEEPRGQSVTYEGIPCTARHCCTNLNRLTEENEQLKHYKEAYGTEIVKIKQTIKDMMENERTELGRSVLKQLWEAIQ